MRDILKSAWSSRSAESREPSKAKGSNAIATIGGSGGSALNSKGSRWRRLVESDEESGREDAKYGLDLVPKHLSGRVEVNVRASPTHTRSSMDVGRSRTKTESEGDEYPLTANRQRTDVEWHVEGGEGSVSGNSEHDKRRDDGDQIRVVGVAS